MAASKNLLLDMPPEMTADVAARLPAKDLLTLRLVSKEVAILTEAAMLKTNFSNLEILFCFLPSFDRAVKIAKHPILKKGVQKITVYHSRFLPAFSVVPAQLKLTNTRPNTPVEQRREIRCSQFAIYGSFVEQQEKLQKSGDNEKMVISIFEEFQEHASLEVVMGELDVRVDSDGRHYCRQGRSGFWQFEMLAEIYDGDLVVDPLPNHGPLKSVLKAIKLTGMHPKRFSEGGQTQGVSPYLFRNGNCFLQAKQNLSRLTHLTLCFDNSIGPMARSSVVDDVVSFLQASASTLKCLDLSMNDDPFECRNTTWCSVFETMTELVTLSALETLKISNVTVDYGKCTKFFGELGSQLKRYSLFNIRVTACGSRISHRQWKAKVKADLRQAGFLFGRGPVLLHHEMYEREEHSDDESEEEGDDDDSIDEDLDRAYPAYRALITG